MNKIQIDQIYTSKLKTKNHSDYIIKVIEIKKPMFDFKTFYICEIIGGVYRHNAYTIHLSKSGLLNNYDFNEILTNEYLIKDIIE